MAVNEPRQAMSVMRMVVLQVVTMGPLIGGFLLYSDASGQRPIHGLAVAAILLLWLPICFLCIVAMELLERLAVSR